MFNDLLSSAIGKTGSITSILICALDWRAATLAELVHTVQGFRNASTLGVKSCPLALSQIQT